MGTEKIRPTKPLRAIAIIETLAGLLSTIFT